MSTAPKKALYAVIALESAANFKPRLFCDRLSTPQASSVLLFARPANSPTGNDHGEGWCRGRLRHARPRSEHYVIAQNSQVMPDPPHRSFETASAQSQAPVPNGETHHLPNSFLIAHDRVLNTFESALGCRAPCAAASPATGSTGRVASAAGQGAQGLHPARTGGRQRGPSHADGAHRNAVAGRRVIEPGWFDVMIGASSADTHLQGEVEVTGAAGLLHGAWRIESHPTVSSA